MLGIIFRVVAAVVSMLSIGAGPAASDAFIEQLGVHNLIIESQEPLMR